MLVLGKWEACECHACNLRGLGGGRAKWLGRDGRPSGQPTFYSAQVESSMLRYKKTKLESRRGGQGNIFEGTERRHGRES